MTPVRMAWTQKIASSAPVAPIMWPVIDLVEEIGTCPARSPRAALIARVSERSLRTVPVPWALM